MAQPKKKRVRPYGMRTTMELLDIGPLGAILALGAALGMLVISVVYFVRSAPPSRITITTGPDRSVYQRYANRYARSLEKYGVKVETLPSKGSKENLERLIAPGTAVDLGFVQAGVVKEPPPGVVSLGSIAYQPLMFFYRGKPIKLISELKGRRIVIGPPGSGVHGIALSILASNGIKEKETTTLLEWEGEQAAEALLGYEITMTDRPAPGASPAPVPSPSLAPKPIAAKDRIDGVFIMGESTPMPLLRRLMRSRDVHLYSFEQASAYARRLDYLNTLEFPAGSIDIGANIPDHDITLMGPIVELIATEDLHPAISDMILEAARELHGRPGTYQKRGEFPRLQENVIPISDDARRFYTSGKTFLYRYLPYGIANLLSRALVAFIPLLILLIPVMKGILAFFRWRAHIKIRRHYRALLSLEDRLLAEPNASERARLLEELGKIEDRVNRTRIPVAFADQYYGLRWHVSYVRGLVGR